jgi:hypothetical protein
MCDVDINVSSSSVEDGGFLLVNLTPPENQALVALPGHGPQSSRVNESQSDVMGLPEPPLLGPPIREKSDESLKAADEKPTHEQPPDDLEQKIPDECPLGYAPDPQSLSGPEPADVTVHEGNLDEIDERADPPAPAPSHG